MSIAEDAGEVVRDAPRPDAAPTPAGRFPVRVERGIDVLIGGLLAAATFFVHDVRYMLTVPLWTDAWIRISRVVGELESSSPAGTLVATLFTRPAAVTVTVLVPAAFSPVPKYT